MINSSWFLFLYLLTNALQGMNYRRQYLFCLAEKAWMKNGFHKGTWKKFQPKEKDAACTKSKDIKL